MMFAIGLFSGLGAYFISQAYRICEAGAVAPFEYSAMPLAFFGVSSFLVNGPIWFHGLESFSLRVPDY